MLLLGYETGYTEEVGLDFGALGDRTCGYIKAVHPAPSRIVENGKVYLKFFISVRFVGQDNDVEAVSDIVMRVKPESDESAGPRTVYIEKVLEQIRDERRRRRGADREPDPGDQPLIDEKP